MRLVNFVKKHWKPLAIGTASAATATASFMYPPAFLAKIVTMLASSPVFGVLGAYAGLAATVVMVAAVAAVTYGTLSVAGRAWDVLNKAWNNAGDVLRRNNKASSSHASASTNQMSGLNNGSSNSAGAAPINTADMSGSNRDAKTPSATNPNRMMVSTGPGRQPQPPAPESSATNSVTM